MVLMEQRIVKGTISRNDFVELTALDILTGHVNTGGVYFFPHQPSFQRMREALSVALDVYPTFGASLIRRDNRYYLHRNNTGVGFSYAQVEHGCPRFDSEVPIVEGSLLLDADVPMEEVFAGKRPLTYFRLTLFSDGSSALGVRNIHSQADGAGIGAFMHCWAALYNKTAIRKPCSFLRDNLTQLGTGDGVAPSRKLSVIPTPALSVGKKIMANKEVFGACYLELPKLVLKAVTERCRAQGRPDLSSSDVIHALAWKAFAISNNGHHHEPCGVFTVCDIRTIDDLGIPAGYEGNALIERAALEDFGILWEMPLGETAALFRNSTKPLLASEVRQDLAYLTRQYRDGRLKGNGNFSGLVRGSLGRCLDGKGLLVNDMRFLSASEISFGQKPIWRETMFSLCFNLVAVYHTTHDTVAFRYVGHKHSLAAFAEALQALAFQEASFPAVQPATGRAQQH